jgi:hypothetical protein
MFRRSPVLAALMLLGVLLTACENAQISAPTYGYGTRYTQYGRD